MDLIKKILNCGGCLSIRKKTIKNQEEDVEELELENQLEIEEVNNYPSKNKGKETITFDDHQNIHQDLLVQSRKQ